MASSSTLKLFIVSESRNNSFIFNLGMKNVHVDFLLVMLVDQSVYMDKWSGGSSLLIALKVADVR